MANILLCAKSLTLQLMKTCGARHPLTAKVLLLSVALSSMLSLLRLRLFCSPLVRRLLLIMFSVDIVFVSVL